MGEGKFPAHAPGREGGPSQIILFHLDKSDRRGPLLLHVSIAVDRFDGRQHQCSCGAVQCWASQAMRSQQPRNTGGQVDQLIAIDMLCDRVDSCHAITGADPALAISLKSGDLPGREFLQGATAHQRELPSVTTSPRRYSPSACQTPRYDMTDRRSSSPAINSPVASATASAMIATIVSPAGPMIASSCRTRRRRSSSSCSPTSSAAASS